MEEPAVQAQWSLGQVAGYGFLGGAALAVAGWLGTSGTPIWLVPATVVAVAARGRRQHLPVAWLLLWAGAALPLWILDQWRWSWPQLLVRGGDLAAMLWLTERCSRRPGALAPVLGAACARVVIEQIERSLGLGVGFVWGGNQLDLAALSQVAYLCGMSGVSFLIVFTSAAVAETILDSQRNGRRRCAALAMALLALVEAVGMERLSRPSTTTVRLGAVVCPDRSTHRQYELTEMAASESPQVVVWPRGSVVLSAHDREGTLEQLASLAREDNLWLVAGVLDQDRHREELLRISPRGRAELLPDDGTWPLPTTAHFGRLAVALDHRLDRQRGVDEALTRTAVLAVPGWSGGHRLFDPLLLARIRAVEEALVVVTATAGGTSVIADPYGRINSSASSTDEPEQVMLADVPVEHAGRGVARVRATVPWLCLLGLLVLLLAPLPQRVVVEL